MDWYNILLSGLPGELGEATWQRVAVVGARRIANLGRNLAVGGALCQAFDLGHDHGWVWGVDGHGGREMWIHNTDGKAAP